MLVWRRAEDNVIDPFDTILLSYNEDIPICNENSFEGSLMILIHPHIQRNLYPAPILRHTVESKLSGSLKFDTIAIEKE